MSDDFDKEAERERLREKYERDKKEREATEQMSELLLQGATMTNAHCSECGDPIFRYDGQEFCPTCERPVERGTNGEGKTDPGDAEEQIEVTAPSDDARVAFGDDGDDKQQTEATADGRKKQTTRDGESESEPRTPDPEATRGPAAGEVERETPSREASREPAARTQQPPEPRERQSSAAATASGGGDIEAARLALVETLTRFSQQAAATDDPHTAREHLAAAREAAEALAALRR